MLLLNARLVQDPVAVAGVMLRTFRAFEGTLLPVFHLEQFDPEDDKDANDGTGEGWVGGLPPGWWDGGGLGGLPREVWCSPGKGGSGWWGFCSWGYCT